MPKTKEEKSKYDQELVKKLYKRVSLYVPRDWAPDLDRITKARGTSLNNYILQAIAAQIQKDAPENLDGSRED